MMKQANNNSARRSKQSGPDSKDVVTIQVIKTPRGTMNHSYRDFSQVKPEAGYEHPKEIKDMTFSQKVHHMLSDQANEKWISWMPHGRAFKVHVPVMFETKICPKYFSHKRYSSFLRDLNNYGFKHISKGTDRNCYYHEFILKDRPHLCQYMPPCRDARRLVADPANEPNFYRISRQYPLDGEAPVQDAADSPTPKRVRTDSAVVPQGVALGAAALGTQVMPPAPVPSAGPAEASTLLLGLITQHAAPSPAAPVVDQRTAMLQSLLEAQNKQREEEKQRNMLMALLQQQQQQMPPPIPAAAPSNGDVLSAVLGMLAQQR